MSDRQFVFLVDKCIDVEFGNHLEAKSFEFQDHRGEVTAKLLHEVVMDALRIGVVGIVLGGGIIAEREISRRPGSAEDQLGEKGRISIGHGVLPFCRTGRQQVFEPMLEPGCCDLTHPHLGRYSRSGERRQYRTARGSNLPSYRPRLALETRKPPASGAVITNPRFHGGTR